MGAQPATYALSALMHLHAARLPARAGPTGNLNAFAEQDRSEWDLHLIEEGQLLLNLSAAGPELTEYHVEAALAAVHTHAPSRRALTDWSHIVTLYDELGDSSVAGGRSEPGDCRRASVKARRRAAGASRDRGPRPPLALSVLFRRAWRSRIAMRTT